VKSSTLSAWYGGQAFRTYFLLFFWLWHGIVDSRHGMRVRQEKKCQELTVESLKKYSQYEGLLALDEGVAKKGLTTAQIAKLDSIMFKKGGVKAGKEVALNTAS
jgi:hypothetical protein